MPELVELITRAIVDEPPLAFKEGGLIRDGFDPGLDELRTAMRGGKDWIAKLAAGRNRAHRHPVAQSSIQFRLRLLHRSHQSPTSTRSPPHYIRKQTIANGERFITPELKEMEGKILGAEERSVKLEYELFQRVREEVLGRLAEIQQTAAALAQLDVLACFAETARLFRLLPSADRRRRRPAYSRWPPSGAGTRCSSEERFVPNDTRLASARSGRRSAQIALITGPNMAGKSTYIRQVALLALLAHTGSFHPGGRSAHRSGGSHFHPHRRERRSGARPIHFHGRDVRNRQHPQQRHRRAA